MKNNYEEDEVVLFEDIISLDKEKNKAKLTLTSKRIIISLEEEKGLFKKIKLLAKEEIFNLSDIKYFNNKPQITLKGNEVFIQTKQRNFNIVFESPNNSKKFNSNLIDAITGKTANQRRIEKIKGAIDDVDDILGFNTRDVLKEAMVNGVKDTMFKIPNKLVDKIPAKLPQKISKSIKVKGKVKK